MNWNDLTSWDWSRLISIIGPFVGAFSGSAVIQGLLPLYRERRQQKAHATYLAMRLAIILEAYASSCMNLISENANREQPPDSQYPVLSWTIPELPCYPDDVDGWRAIAPILAEQCLNLRNKISASQLTINGTIEFATDDLETAVIQNAAKRGIDAWNIATKLRSHHAVKPADTVWPYAEALQDALDQSEKAEKASREAMRDFFMEARGEK